MEPNGYILWWFDFSLNNMFFRFSHRISRSCSWCIFTAAWNSSMWMKHSFLVHFTDDKPLVLFPISWYLNSAIWTFPLLFLGDCVHVSASEIAGSEAGPSSSLLDDAMAFQHDFNAVHAHTQSGSVLSSQAGGCELVSLFFILIFNSHTVWYTTLKCRVQWFLAYSQDFL